MEEHSQKGVPNMTEMQPTILVQGIPTDRKAASKAPVVVADNGNTPHDRVEEEREDAGDRQQTSQEQTELAERDTEEVRSQEDEQLSPPAESSKATENIQPETTETPETENSEEQWFGMPSWLGGGTPKHQQQVEHEPVSEKAVESEPTSGNAAPSNGVDEKVELQDVYLPSWLRWIDPTLNKDPPSSDTSRTAGENPPGMKELPSPDADDAEVAAAVRSMEVDDSTVAKGSPPCSPEDVQVPEVRSMKEEEDKVDTKEELEAKDALRRQLVADLRSAITSKGRYHVDVAEFSTKLGKLLTESNEHKQALKLYRDAVSIYSSKLGDDHTMTMDTRLELGHVLERSGQYDEAVNTYYLVTVMRRALKGEKDPSAADSLVCIAHALRKKGDYLQAIKELKRALKIYRESLGDAHRKVSNTVDEIASLYVTVGDFEKSAAILEEVVKLKAATLGMKSKEVSATLVSLATTYECSEEFNKSMKTLKKAYKIETDLGGYSSEGSTDTLNRIANLYQAMGDHNRASIAYLGVLRGRKIRVGEDDLTVGEAYYMLGRTLRETGQHEKSLKCMKEALPIFVSKGVEIQDVERIAEIMHQMALLNKDKKKLAEASRIFKQELGVRRKIGQPEFPTIARTLNHLGVIEFEQNNNARALKYMVEALTIFEKRGEQGIDCAEVLFNSGLVFEACKNNARALEAFEEAARIFRHHGYKEDHPHLVKSCKKIDKLQKIVRTASS